MLTIRYDYVDNHFIDKFVPLYHLGYFIKSDGRKLTAKYIYVFFTLSGTKFCIFIFKDAFVSELHIQEQKWLFTLLLFYTFR